MSEIPVVAAVRRYLNEAVSGRDFGVLAEILVPDYRFDGGGTAVVGRDRTYIPMVSTYLSGEPTIDTAVHEIVTDGRHAVVWLTKHTDTPRAAWEAVLLYRARGKLLERCWSEQDWATRRGQLKGELPAPELPIPTPGVWGAPQLAPNPATEEWARTWLTSRPGELADATSGGADAVLDVSSATVNCLFTAGDRFGFHVTHRGTYLGGLPGCADQRGRAVDLNVAGLGSVTAGDVSCARAITDSTELRRRMAAPAVSTTTRPPA